MKDRRIQRIVREIACTYEGCTRSFRKPEEVIDHSIAAHGNYHITAKLTERGYKVSKRRPDREDVLKERRAKIVTLSKDGLSVSRIAIEFPKRWLTNANTE